MSFTKKEYDFLKQIGIGPKNLGCYVNGTWKATGPVISTLNPANNQTIAEVVEASAKDYEEGMQACSEAAKVWVQVYVTMPSTSTASVAGSKHVKCVH